MALLGNGGHICYQFISVSDLVLLNMPLRSGRNVDLVEIETRDATC